MKGGAYCYHSFTNHQNDDWYWVQHKEGFGGYTLYIDPIAKCVGVSVCSYADRFSRKKGREVAFERLCKAKVNEKAVMQMESFRDTWTIAVPNPIKGSSDARFVKRCAIRCAIHKIMMEHEAISFLVVTR